MSGPKVVQDASIDLPNVGTVTAVDRVEAILSAVALAMGMTVDFIGAANSNDIMDGGAGGAGLPPVKSGLAADPAATCPEESMNVGLKDGAEPDASTLCPEEGLVTFEGGETRVGKKGKNKKRSGLSEVADVQHQSDGEGIHFAPAEGGPARKNNWPDDELDGSSVGWNVVGKKGKRKK